MHGSILARCLGNWPELTLQQRIAMAPIRNEAVNSNEVPQYLNGHYGSLDEHQQGALDDFRSLIVQRGYADFQTATPSQDIKLL